MPKLTMWHNPRCSTSRKTLSLLETHGLQANIVEYLKTPPSAADLKSVLKMLHMKPRELMRKKEAVYADLKLDNAALSEDQLINAMVENPVLIERPVVIYGPRAALGRPPENILDLFNDLG